MNRTVPLPNPRVEALIPSVTISGDRAFKEAIKVELGHRCVALM